MDKRVKKSMKNLRTTKRIMMGGFAASLMVIASISSAHAGTDGSLFEGFYLGMKASSTVTTGNMRHILLAGRPAKYVPAFGDSFTLNSPRGYGGGLYAGFGMSFGTFNLGIEASFDISRGQFNMIDTDNKTFGVNPRNTFGLAMRLGVEASDSILIYGLVGYETQKMKITGFVDPADKENTLGEGFGGVRFGGGVEILIMENVALRVEYTQTRFFEKTFIKKTKKYDQFIYKPRNSSINVGLILHMN
jgi:opacity protein-like surface antigen